MARVEWTRQSGEDVEAVVAMLLCSRYPDAVRVRPSQGDGGIDVFVPGPAGSGAERAVYQVKKYCENLNGTQKREIKKSYKRVLETSKNEGWRITEWHLVMPLDPTSHNLGWLNHMIADADFPCEVNGLIYCDTLAADYPKVIDHYLRDGKDRLQAAMNNLTALLSGRKNREENEALMPADMMPDLAAIHQALNACDPFYKYDFAVSDQPPSDQPGPGEPGLVAVYAIQRDSVWVTIRIFALSLAALQERPISMQFKLTAPAGDEQLRQQVQKFIDYGAPLSMPEGTVSGTLDLPAGLGGDLHGASLQVVSAGKQVASDQTELTLAMLAPDSDAVIAGTTIKRTDYSLGQGGGFRSLWTDNAELFIIEMLAIGNEVNMGLQVNYDLNGRRPVDIVDSLRFLAAMHAPNRLGFGLTYGPREFSIAGEAPGDLDSSAKRWAVIADALVRIQDHVTALLRMPAQMTEKQAGDIIEAAKLVSGEALSGELSGAFTVYHTDADIAPQLERELSKVYEFVAIKTIEITLGRDVIPVGKEALFFLGRYLDVGDESSKIEPVSQGISIRYTGQAEVGRVLARHLQGIVSTEANENPRSDHPLIGGG